MIEVKFTLLLDGTEEEMLELRYKLLTMYSKGGFMKDTDAKAFAHQALDTALEYANAGDRLRFAVNPLEKEEDFKNSPWTLLVRWLGGEK